MVKDQLERGLAAAHPVMVRKREKHGSRLLLPTHRIRRTLSFSAGNSTRSMGQVVVAVGQVSSLGVREEGEGGSGGDGDGDNTTTKDRNISPTPTTTFSLQAPPTNPDRKSSPTSYPQEILHYPKSQHTLHSSPYPNTEWNACAVWEIEIDTSPNGPYSTFRTASPKMQKT